MSTGSKVDPAILRALSIDSTTAKIANHGGSGFASTFRITTPTTSIFVKTSSSPGAAVMFEGEHASLNAINSAVPSLCPRSLAWGQLENKDREYFLATEFLDLSGRGSRQKSSSGMTLAQKLAKLHSTRVEGSDSGFGFPVTTCCGETPQPNTYKESWAEFFAENRLRAILDRAERNQGKDAELRRVVEQTCDKVVPRLLGDGHLGGSKGKIQPVVAHGDLWSGNKGRGVFIGRNENEAEEEVIYDPSSTYAHSEYDHGIMNMFGGFGRAFWDEYFSIVPKTEPVNEYDDRVRLYESYHHLNHYAMFGGGYKGGTLGLLRPLVRKYAS